ncbi:permease, partial [Parabacteroides sp. OttesenSCG-928-G21]|nr:permease [Parabacteroides sp. OttesenSCG-928-G21]
METKKELKTLLWMIVIFSAVFFMPLNSEWFITAIEAALDLSKWYAQEHVVMCLLPAFFIAGVIAVFISQGAVLKYFGANAKKWLSYSVAAVSGAILAVCSCTILPLFTSIYKRGAGLGPAIAFLYSGPAISILSIILTWRILGIEMGIARMVGSVLFSVIIGLIMAFIYRKEEKAKKEEQMNIIAPPEKRPMSQTMFHFFTLILILVFANWGAPAKDDTSSIWFYIFTYKWYITGIFSLLFAYSLVAVLKIKWQWVLAGVLVTVLSALLTYQYVSNPKLAPLIPMIVGLVCLSFVTL